MRADESTLTFDEAEWLTGRAAEDAAIHAGFCSEDSRGDCVPNNFFIENASPTTVDLPVAPDVRIIMLTWRMEETGEVTSRPLPLGDFITLINNSELHWRELPYTVTLEGGEVVRIEEVYIP